MTTTTTRATPATDNNNNNDDDNDDNDNDSAATEKKLEEIVEVYRDKVLSRYPPAFHRWFIARFSAPAAWFKSRLLFSRSLAAWSMVGHVLGLGDR